MAWVSRYGTVGLFLIAVAPLPQTPALIFFSIVGHDYPSVFLAILIDKSPKYGLFAWLTARFPERFNNGNGGLLPHGD